MTGKSRKIAGICVFAIGILFIIYGVHRGEVNTVLSKAVRICLECVGIG
ncbi:MAG: CD1871A family CXXC motif-containing protein [Eubacterium sp.]|nr:CD1871A family CXXC motif-containing protein [Eubacterium sp.]